MFELIAENNSF